MRRVHTVALLTIVLLHSVSEGQQGQSPTGDPKSKATQASAVLRYTPEDVIGIMAIQPSRMLKSESLRKLVEAASGQQEVEEMMNAAARQLGMDPSTLEEAAILFDRETIDGAMGPQRAPAGDDAQLKNKLKQFALAMHILHDTYGRFPDDDGLDDENKGNLSWRVYMLPFLDQADLYNQFHLDEPWDSDHNKTLIEMMPEIFQSPGVTEKGKTSVHVFTGEGSPFADDKGPGIRDITDGTSNTIMMVLTGADKADVWTKPGGLDFDPENPVKALGKIDGQFLVGLMDGSVRPLPVEIEPAVLASLITAAGGEVVDYDTLSGDRSSRVKAMPGIILRSNAPLDRDAVFNISLVGLGEGKPGKIDAQEVTVFESCMVALPDDRTLLIGPEPLLKKMLASRAAAGQGTGTVRKQLAENFPANDIAGMIDLEPLKDLRNQMAKNTPMPGLFEGLQGAVFTADLAGTGTSLTKIEVRTANKNSAMQLSALAQGMLQMQKAQILGMTNVPESPLTPDTAETLAELFDTVKITTKDSSVLYDMPKPGNMASFVESMKPAFVELFSAIRQARKAAFLASRKNNLKQIGLAFHNYHDVYNHFPAANGNGEQEQGNNTGLSWRVYLLPFVEEAELYNQFNMDEDWDSPHNKALIEQMPDVFKVAGIDKKGHTTIHVFAGDDTAMRMDDGVGLGEITDGSSNTILAVVAGPETAEIWTKPGGLEFNADEPRKVFGTLGELFLVLMCDGAVRYLNSDIDDETLRNLIQRHDGNVVEIE
ncbi:MAG: DUF1559 domain-containing protein [Planctomycetaceae bacterium]|nr:DUF1559 domain-containing protein [Planctomycetaceae bacterium]